MCALTETRLTGIEEEDENHWRGNMRKPKQHSHTHTHTHTQVIPFHLPLHTHKHNTTHGNTQTRTTHLYTQEKDFKLTHTQNQCSLFKTLFTAFLCSAPFIETARVPINRSWMIFFPYVAHEMVRKMQMTDDTMHILSEPTVLPPTDFLST